MSVSSPKSVLVTGASRGLGLAVSQRLAQEGYQILGIGRTVSPDFLTIGPTHRFYEFDLRDLGSIKQLVAQIMLEQSFAPFGLVNNSAIGRDGVLATQHERDIAETLTVNLHAPLLLTKYVVRHMIRAKEGRVVNISSIIASTGFGGLAAYAATKGGLESFTKSLAREVGRAGVTVNSVAPGFMRTGMTKNLSLENISTISRRAPLGLAETSDVAMAVSYLLGKSGDKVTGTVITVDGGSTA